MSVFAKTGLIRVMPQRNQCALHVSFEALWAHWDKARALVEVSRTTFGIPPYPHSAAGSTKESRRVARKVLRTRRPARRRGVAGWKEKASSCELAQVWEGREASVEAEDVRVVNG